MAKWWLLAVGALIVGWAIAAGAVNQTVQWTVSAPSASNCSTSPPAPAARAGYTTLAYCLDPPQAVYADPTNWIDCTWGDAHPTANQKWFVSQNYWGTDCGKSTTHPMFVQAVDPTTGKTDLLFHWDSLKDTNQSTAPISPGGPAVWTMGTVGGANGTSTAGWLDFPAASYFTVRFRQTPTVTPYYGGCLCQPDFFLWSSATWTNPTQTDNIPGGTYNAGSNPNGCSASPDSESPPLPYNRSCSNGHIEVDVLESSVGNGIFDGIRECSMPGGCNFKGPTSGAPNGNAYTGFFSGDSTGTVSGNTHDQELWTRNNLSGSPYQPQTTFGFMYTTDGVSKRQGCWYFNDVKVVVPADIAGIACGAVDYVGTPAIALSPNTLQMRINLAYFLAGPWALNSAVCQGNSACVAGGGGPNQDTYIERIEVWSCANWNTYNQHNGFDSQPPCVNSNPLPQ